MAFDKGGLDSYNDVASRIVEFRTKHPDGSLQPVDPANPFEIVTFAERTFLVYKAAAYRTPDDTRPGIGVAWEPLPGRTPYTKDSEVMVAETSAWGRAIVAALAADTRKGVASADEIRNRHAEQDEAEKPPTDRQVVEFKQFAAKIERAKSQQDLNLVGELVRDARGHSHITLAQYNSLGEKAIAKSHEFREPA